MTKTKTTTTSKTSKPKKTVGQKVDKKIEAIAKVDDVIVEEINEPVGTVTIKRWQMAVIAVAVTAVILFVVL